MGKKNPNLSACGLSLLFVTAVLLSGCETIEEFAGYFESDESVLIVKAAAAEAIFRNDDTGSAQVCTRAYRGIEIVSEARGVVDDGLLSLVDIKKELYRIIITAELNPVTSTILLDVGTGIVSKYTDQVNAGTISEDARVSLTRLLDAIEEVANLALGDCET